jgi:hypothetical protein
MSATKTHGLPAVKYGMAGWPTEVVDEISDRLETKVVSSSVAATIVMAMQTSYSLEVDAVAHRPCGIALQKHALGQVQ